MELQAPLAAANRAREWFRVRKTPLKHCCFNGAEGRKMTITPCACVSRGSECILKQCAAAEDFQQRSGARNEFGSPQVGLYTLKRVHDCLFFRTESELARFI